MRRRFEYRDEKSEKFWEIELKGSSFTTYYGKIGGGPRQDTKEWGSPAEAKKEYEKIVAEKLKKGYEEVSGKGSSDNESKSDSKKKKSIEVNKEPVTPGKSRRRFEYIDEKSSKFWEIELNGTAYTTYFGKIGGSTRTDINDFGSEVEAAKQYEKIVAEKLKKGYEEVTSPKKKERTESSSAVSEFPEFAKFKVPSKFKNLEAKIRSTLKLSVNVELKGKPSDPWSSKVGGNPYLPIGTEYPSVQKGKHLFLLAQINFAEMPPLPDYPNKGLLQFFIGDNELYGLDLESPFKSDYKIVYYPEVINDRKKLISDFSFLPERKYTPLDSNFESAMRFRKAAVPMSSNDYRFEDTFPELSEDYDLCDEYQEFSGALGTKIGGYSDFTQEDPRVRKPLKGYELLFQLDSEGDICWGDMGVGNFFIKPEDLKKKDFSKVLYNWDCT